MGNPTPSSDRNATAKRTGPGDPASISRSARPWYDPELPVLQVDILTLMEEHLYILGHWYGVWKTASLIPRRLGKSATRQELARDKKTTSSLAWTYLGLHRQFSPMAKGATIDLYGISQEQASAGAQIDVPSSIRYRLSSLEFSATNLVTAAVRLGEKRLANKLAHVCLGEQQALEHALRRY